MEQITLRIPEDTLEDLEQEAGEHGRTRSEHLRDVLETRTEHENEHGEGECIPVETHAALQKEHDELQTEVKRIRRENRQILEQRQENTELVKYVEEERSLTRQKAEAGITTRAKWWLFGMKG